MSGSLVRPVRRAPFTRFSVSLAEVEKQNTVEQTENTAEAESHGQGIRVSVFGGVLQPLEGVVVVVEDTLGFGQGHASGARRRLKYLTVNIGPGIQFSLALKL